MIERKAYWAGECKIKAAGQAEEAEEAGEAWRAGRGHGDCRPVSHRGRLWEKALGIVAISGQMVTYEALAAMEWQVSFRDMMAVALETALPGVCDL